MVEYALLIAGVVLVSAAATAIFGHKTSDLIAGVAAVLPGAHEDDNAPIVSGKVIETAANADGNLTLDMATIAGAASGTERLGYNLGLPTGETTPGALSALVVEVEPQTTP